MSEKHRMGADGVLNDGVSHYPADEHDLQSYRDAQLALSQLPVPILVSAQRPHERLFVAAFDGTGNDAGQVCKAFLKDTLVTDKCELEKPSLWFAQSIRKIGKENQ
jgi:hypothetical protein